jgi:hypothetical protein
MTARRYTTRSRRRRHHAFDLEVIRDPAVTLAGVRERVTEDLWRLVLCAWGDAPEYRTMVTERFMRCDLLTIARRGDEVVGFSAIAFRRIAGRPILVLLGMVVAPSCAGHGLAVRMSSMHIARWVWRCLFRGYVVYRSQDPRMLGAAIDRGTAFPQPRRRTPPEVVKIAREMAALIAPDKKFEDDTLAMRDALPLALSHPPADGVHHSAEVVAFCRRHLDYTRGDAFIIVTHIGPTDFARHVLLPLTGYRLLARARTKLRRRARVTVLDGPHDRDDETQDVASTG